MEPTDLTSNQPNPVVPPVPTPQGPQIVNSPVVEPQQSGVKTAIVATVINIVVTFLLFHTYNFDILFSGIYLGLSKGTGLRTGLVFFVVNFIFFFLDSAIFKDGLVDPQRGLVAGIFITAFSSALLAIIPLGIMWAVRKVRGVS